MTSPLQKNGPKTRNGPKTKLDKVIMRLMAEKLARNKALCVTRAIRMSLAANDQRVEPSAIRRLQRKFKVQGPALIAEAHRKREQTAQTPAAADTLRGGRPKPTWPSGVRFAVPETGLAESLGLPSAITRFAKEMARMEESLLQKAVKDAMRDPIAEAQNQFYGAFLAHERKMRELFADPMDKFAPTGRAPRQIMDDMERIANIGRRHF